MRLALKSRALFICAALTCAASAVLAQDQQAEQGDYKQMLDQAMKSGNYGQNQPENWDARLKVISGTVMVKPMDAEEWSTITGGMPLDPGDSVKTATDGIAELYLDNKGAISVGRNTELELSSLDQSDTVFSLGFGSIVAKVKHFLNEKFKMQVRTPAAVCAVRGTEFAVEYSQLGKDTSVAVFDEGRVVVTPSDAAGAGQDYTLEKNTELLFGPSHKRFHPSPISLMARHRSMIATMRTRLKAIGAWRPRSQARRSELRDQALKRKIIRRQLGVQGPKVKAQAAKKKAAAVRAKAAAKRAKARKAARKDPAPPAEQEP